MKRKAKPTGGGGHLRLALLIAATAALFLVPAAAASASPAHVHIVIEGAGEGSVNGITFPDSELINCHKPPQGGDVCDIETEEEFLDLEEHTVLGSNFAGWTVEGEAFDPFGCQEGTPPECLLLIEEEGEVTVKATFTKPDVHIIIKGKGSGKVVGEHENPLAGIPEVNCEYVAPGPQTGACDVEHGEAFGTKGINVKAEPTGSSEFAGFTLVKGTSFGAGCGPAAELPEYCIAKIAGTPKEIIAEAEFTLPRFPLTLTKSGEGASFGSFECDTGSGPGPCQAQYEEGAELEVIAGGTGAELAEWTTGPCASSTEATCEFTMPSEAVSANAEFDVAPEHLTVTPEGEGEGTIQCEDVTEGGGLGLCAEEYLHGHTIKVVATPAAENLVESISGPGCSIIGEGESGECEFEIAEATSVTVVFESAGTKASVPATIEGEVPITTSLEGCELPVVLGPFVPAVNANYEGTCSLTATSTGNATELSANDPDESATKGHLVQPPYRLPSALETRATGLAGLEFPGTGYPFAPLTSTVPLLNYAGPVSADNVTVRFKQHIGLHDALHTGTYSKTITLTLEQTTP